jgi:hypothetical protein
MRRVFFRFFAGHILRGCKPVLVYGGEAVQHRQGNDVVREREKKWKQCSEFYSADIENRTEKKRGKENRLGNTKRRVTATP